MPASQGYAIDADGNAVDETTNEETTTRKRGRPKVKNPEAPHGYLLYEQDPTDLIDDDDLAASVTEDPEETEYRDDDGNPVAYAPYGYLYEGTDRQKPRVYALKTAALDDDDAELFAQPMRIPAAMMIKTAPTRARDDKQLAMDATVLKMYRAWIDAGSPTTWVSKNPNEKTMVSTNVVGGWYWTPAKVPGVKLYIKRACEYAAHTDNVEIRPRYGTPVPGSGDNKGKVFLPFAVVDKRTNEQEGTGHPQ
jgi:hypothetical protein